MSERTADEIDELIGHIRKHLALLKDAEAEVRAAPELDIPKIGRTPRAAVLVAGLLENYYTCAETAFVRISRHFRRCDFGSACDWDRLDELTTRLFRTHPRLTAELERFVEFLRRVRD